MALEESHLILPLLLHTIKSCSPVSLKAPLEQWVMFVNGPVNSSWCSIPQIFPSLLQPRFYSGDVSVFLHPTGL